MPSEARLDLHTRQGDIWVGQAYVGASQVQSPTAVRSIKARADFDGSDWTYQGDIFVETARKPVGGPVFPVTYLDLEGVRQVEIHSDDALVQARARGGTWRPARPRGRAARRPFVSLRAPARGGRGHHGALPLQDPLIARRIMRCRRPIR